FFSSRRRHTRSTRDWSSDVCSSDLPLREVRRIDDTHFSYTWHPNGAKQQGVFHIVLQIPGRRIAWRTMSQGFMSGVVSFEPRSQIGRASCRERERVLVVVVARTEG